MDDLLEALAKPTSYSQVGDEINNQEIKGLSCQPSQFVPQEDILEHDNLIRDSLFKKTYTFSQQTRIHHIHSDGKFHN